ncbi:MAG TPA: methylated-DNA--[protein]-cysteine S-methyltransferase [Gemmatimonadaceae bacterium]
MPDDVVYDEIPSPLGALLLAASAASAGGEAAAGLVCVYFDARRHGSNDADIARWRPVRDAGEPAARVLRAAREQLGEYFAGRLTTFDLPLAPRGTPFQHRVWNALREIPYGRTVSYSAIALRIGAPDAVRAVGAANGRNPLSIIVPCHRVIGADGTLTGYGGGIDRKRWLLAHEGWTGATDGMPSLFD